MSDKRVVARTEKIEKIERVERLRLRNEMRWVRCECGRHREKG